MALLFTAAQRHLQKALTKQSTEFKLGDTKDDLDYFIWHRDARSTVEDNMIDFNDFANHDIVVDEENGQTWAEAYAAMPQNWRAVDNILMLWIKSNVNKAAIPEVNNLNMKRTTFGIMEIIRNRYGRDSGPKKREVGDKMDETKLRDTNAKAYLKEMERLRIIKEALGTAYTEAAFIGKVLDNITGEQWATHVTFIRVQVDANGWSFDSVRNHLIDSQLNLERKNRKAELQKAMFAGSSSKKRRGRRRNTEKDSKGPDNGSNNGGNRSSGNKSSKGRKNKRDLSKIECWNCHQFGHYRNKCPEPRQENSSDDDGEANFAFMGMEIDSSDSSSNDFEVWTKVLANGKRRTVRVARDLPTEFQSQEELTREKHKAQLQYAMMRSNQEQAAEAHRRALALHFECEAEDSNRMSSISAADNDERRKQCRTHACCSALHLRAHCPMQARAIGNSITDHAWPTPQEAAVCKDEQDFRLSIFAKQPPGSLSWAQKVAAAQRPFRLRNSFPSASL